MLSGVPFAPFFDGQKDDRLIGVADCAVCAAPDETELADIAVSSADMYSSVLRQEARVAMISYSTLGSGESESVKLVRRALALAKAKRPELLIEGEYQIDAALVPQIAARKVTGASQVAGQANVLVFPNLDTGNVAVKCMQMFGNRGAFGPILQGFDKPVTDFSRAATVDDVIGNVTLCLAALPEPEK